MTINHDHLHGTTDKAVSLEEDYRKISAMYIDAINKSDKLDMENTELKRDIISYNIKKNHTRHPEKSGCFLFCHDSQALDHFREVTKMINFKLPSRFRHDLKNYYIKKKPQALYLQGLERNWLVL